MKTDQVVITQELVNAGAANGIGGWSNEQMQLLGVETPPRKGWLERVIGQPISRADAERFVALKGQTKARKTADAPVKQVNPAAYKPLEDDEPEDAAPGKELYPESRNPASLTPQELQVIHCLRDAWNAFSSLPVQHPNDECEFGLAVHALQGLVAVRVARRVDPHVWVGGE